MAEHGGWHYYGNSTVLCRCNSWHRVCALQCTHLLQGWPHVASWFVFHEMSEFCSFAVRMCTFPFQSGPRIPQAMEIPVPFSTTINVLVDNSFDGEGVVTAGAVSCED